MKIFVLTLILVLSSKALGASDCSSRLELLSDPLIGLIVSLVKKDYVADSTRKLLVQGIIPPVEEFEFKGLNEGQILSYKNAMSMAGVSKTASNASEILKSAIEGLSQSKADMRKTKESTKSIWHQPVLVSHPTNALNTATTSLRVRSNHELLVLTREKIPDVANQLVIGNVPLKSSYVIDRPGKDLEIIAHSGNYLKFFNSKGEDAGRFELPENKPKIQSLYFESQNDSKLSILIKRIKDGAFDTTSGIFDLDKRDFKELSEKSWPLIFLPGRTVIRKDTMEIIGSSVFGRNGKRTETKIMQLEAGPQPRILHSIDQLAILQGKNNGYYIFNEELRTKIYDVVKDEIKDFNFQAIRIDKYGFHINAQGQEVFYMRVIGDTSSRFIAWNATLDTFESLGDISFPSQYHTTLPSGHFFAAATTSSNGQKYLAYFHSGLAAVRKYRIPESFSIIGAQETADQLILLGLYDGPKALTQHYMAFELYGPNHQ